MPCCIRIIQISQSGAFARRINTITLYVQTEKYPEVEVLFTCIVSLCMLMGMICVGVNR